MCFSIYTWVLVESREAPCSSGVTQLTDMGAGNRTWVLCKSSASVSAAVFPSLRPSLPPPWQPPKLFFNPHQLLPLTYQSLSSRGSHSQSFSCLSLPSVGSRLLSEPQIGTRTKDSTAWAWLYLWVGSPFSRTLVIVTHMLLYLSFKLCQIREGNSGGKCYIVEQELTKCLERGSCIWGTDIKWPCIA